MDYCCDPKTEVKKPTKKPDPCKKNNGGCYSKRKCTNVNGKAKCGNCPKGYTNLGATKCKKAAPVDKNLSGGNSGGAKNLKACTGECDADSQCAKGLKCFQRSKGEKIPGCKGNGGGKDWDYCYNPVHGGIKNLSGGNSGSAKNLQRCTGECDADSQCAYGLKCFQRSRGEPIPSCKGNGGGKDWDYCYDPKIAKPTKALVLKRTTRYTKNTQARGQVIGYLDRHLVQGPANSVLTSFKFIHGGGANMRFQYTTVTFPASKVGKTVTRYTKYNDGFGRNLEYPDRHNVAAPGKCEFLASFFFQRSGNNMRYKFTTRTVPCTGSCKGLYTKCNDFDGKKIECLDRHYINAPNNYGLKRFMPTRSGCSRGKQRYYYVACQFKLK